MKYPCDLQLHSNLSDGDHPIERVIRLAKKNGLRAISITDHNTWLNLEKKNQLAKKWGIIHIPGIEISTKFLGIEVHILGYSFNFNINILKRGLKKTIEGYNKRASLMVKKLKKAGIVYFNFKKIKNKKGKNLAITKYDIAKLIAAKLKISNLKALKLLNKGGVAYVPYGSWAMAPGKAVKLIQRAGGIAVLAHPPETLYKLIDKFGIKKGKNKFNQLFKNLIKNKIDGIEVFAGKYSTQENKKFLKLAKRFNLIITGGSDWHGEKHHPELKMGSTGLSKKEYQKFLETINNKFVNKICTIV